MDPDLPHQRTRLIQAFTLIEVLLGTVIVTVLLVLMITLMTQASSIWQRSSASVDAFQSARLAYELIARNLSQATLNTYLDYDDPLSPSNYLRMSELAFVSGAAGAAGLPGTPGSGQAVFFQAPLGYCETTKYDGLDTLLNTCGYYVDFSMKTGIPSHVIPRNNPCRYRLMQMLVPTEKNDIYKSIGGTAWFSSYSSMVYPIADNIIALVIRPQDPAVSPPDISTASFSYDTRKDARLVPQPVSANQMPPVIQVSIVAIDEASAARIASGNSQPAVISEALSNKFEIPAAYPTDLATLESDLNRARVTYRIFSSAVPIRESKWTK